MLWLYLSWSYFYGLMVCIPLLFYSDEPPYTYIEHFVWKSKRWMKLQEGQFVYLGLVWVLSPLWLTLYILFYLWKVIKYLFSLLCSLLGFSGKSFVDFGRTFVKAKKRRTWEDTLALAEDTIADINSFINDKFKD